MCFLFFFFCFVLFSDLNVFMCWEPLVSILIGSFQELLQEIEDGNVRDLSGDTGQIIKQIWETPAIQEAFEKKTDFQPNDSANFFFENLDRIAAPNYVPEYSDILRARQMTTGVQCIEFVLDGYQFIILDAGGQRSQRHDWSSFFEGLDAFIFVVAISEYDMVLAEDRATNRMHESLQGSFPFPFPFPYPFP